MACSDLSIATWNLDRPWKNGKTRRAREQVDLMLAADADIWVLTETWTGLHLPGYTSVRSPSSLGIYDMSESAAAIHVRDDWELREVESTTLTICAEARRPAMATPLLIIGTIIPWHAAPGGRPWEVHEREAQVQANAWVRLRQSFPEHLLIVAGDFNTTLFVDGKGYGTDVGRSCVRRGLATANLACPTASIAIPNGQGDPSGRAVIDHILVDRRLVVGSEVKADLRSGSTGRRLRDHPLLSLTTQAYC